MRDDDTIKIRRRAFFRYLSADVVFCSLVSRIARQPDSSSHHSIQSKYPTSSSFTRTPTKSVWERCMHCVEYICWCLADGIGWNKNALYLRANCDMGLGWPDVRVICFALAFHHSRAVWSITMVSSLSPFYSKTTTV